MINNITLTGRLIKDSDLRYTPSGSAVANFTLAVNRNFKNANGEYEADFLNCVIWRKPAEVLAEHTRKGSLIGLTGRLQTRSYENQEGKKVFVTEVIVDQFSLLDSKKNNDSGNTSQPVNNAFSNAETININDDDLPF